MRISAKADYAVRAVVELAAADGEKPVKAERIATADDIAQAAATIVRVLASVRRPD